MSESRVDRAIRGQNWLDTPAAWLQKLITGVYRILGPVGRGLKNVLHGTWPLGHPLHPALTDVPLGAWLAVVVLDVVAHYSATIPPQAAEVVMVVGLVGAVGAALTGYTDFNDTFGHERRVAFTHGLTMTLVFALMIASEVLRRWGGHQLHATAVGLSFVGVALMVMGAYLGGHLVFVMGTMVNRNAFFNGPDDFTDVGAASSFAEGELQRVMAGDLPVLVTRTGGVLSAIGAVCSHAGGPLDEGKVVKGCVVCPWHGSAFDIRSGAVRTGPATASQPALEVREVDGRVAVKPSIPMH